MATQLVNVFDKGAESVIIQGELLGKKIIVKYRVKKPYRHPKFDEIFRKGNFRPTYHKTYSLSSLCLKKSRGLRAKPEKSLCSFSDIGDLMRNCTKKCPYFTVF